MNVLSKEYLLSKDFLLRIEKIFTVVALLFFTEGVIRLVLTGGANQGEQAKYDASLAQMIALCIYAVTFTLLVMRWKKVWAYVSRDVWILPLIGLAVVSVFWSEFPSMTFRRSFALIGTSAFGVYFATRYTIHQQLRLLGWMFGIAVILSFIFILFFPNYGVSSGIHAGAWRGIWNHKNGLAQKMAIGANVLLILSLSEKEKPWILWGLLLGAVMLEVNARSTAGLVSMGFAMIIIPVVQTLRWQSRFLLPAIITLFAISGLSLILLAYGAESFLAFFGENNTLTGRTEFWPLIIAEIQERPLLGYGYESFWEGGFNGPAADIAYATMGRYTPTHAHNGFLQLWLHLGFVGVWMFVVGLWTTILRAIAFIRVEHSFEAIFPLLYCCLIILFNLSESVVLEYNQIAWVIYIAMALSVLHLPEITPSNPDNNFSRSSILVDHTR
jgi:O-antigen ligase